MSRDLLDEIKELLKKLVDPEPCWVDHNGECQAHGSIPDFPGEVCVQARLKIFLEQK